MPLNTPNTPQEIENNIKTDVSREIPNSRPWLRNSWFSALIVGLSFRLFDVYDNIKEAVKEAFYDTSSLDNLIRQAGWYGITRNAATNASGYIIVGGTPATAVPSGTEFVTSDDITIETTSGVSISSKSVAPASITSSGTTATVTFSSAHELSQGIQITVAGCNETEYNGTFDITVVDDVTVEYELPSSTTSPATGTITVDYDSAKIPCDAVDFGDDTNLEEGTRVDIVVAIPGIDGTAYVYADAFSGGADIESVEDFRSRFLTRVRNPISNFNDAAIREKAREIFGVTRVFIQDATPNPGEVTIYPLFDNRTSIIPTAGDLTEIKNSILEIKPANTSDDDVIVSALSGTATAFTFTAIAPDTTEMRQAVEDSLLQFFSTQVQPETNVAQDAFKTAIYNTVDPVTGDRIESFTLSSPAADITVGAGEIATLGTVSF